MTFPHPQLDGSDHCLIWDFPHSRLETSGPKVVYLGGDSQRLWQGSEEAREWREESREEYAGNQAASCRWAPESLPGVEPLRGEGLGVYLRSLVPFNTSSSPAGESIPIWGTPLAETNKQLARVGTVKSASGIG